MPARPNAARRQRPQPVAPDPWSSWIDFAVSIGYAVVAYEMALAAVLSPVAATRDGPVSSRLALVHSPVHSSDVPIMLAQRHARPVLHAVPRRDEGTA